MITRIPALLLAITLVLPLAATPDEKTTVADGETIALATVNDEPVLARDVVALFNKRHAGHAKFLGGEVEARRFLEIVIDDRLLVQEAYELGLAELPEVRRYVDEYASVQMAKYYVASQITEAVKTTPEEVRDVWENGLSTFVHARHIVVPTRAEAEEVHAALLAGADFDTLARACSISDSRRRGGNIMAGWGQLDPEWERVVFALEDGEISPVIEVDGQFEIVQLTQRVEVQRPELESVSKKIDDALFRRKMEARKAEVARTLWNKYDVQLRLRDASPLLLQRLLASAPKTVVATWNGGSLTVEEIFEPGELEPLMGADPVKARREIENEIRQTLNAPLVALEGKAMKLDEIPAVAEEIARYEDYVVESVLFRDHIFKNLDVTDAELQAYYDAHAAELERQEQRRVAQILVLSEADAQKVYEEAVAPNADFVELVKKHSRDMVSAAAGGDLGWVTADKVPGAFAAVLTAKPGEILKPVKSASGWHVIRLLEVQPKAMPPLAEVRETVRERALEAKKRDARAHWVSKLREASDIRIDDAAIATFVEAHQTAGPPAQHGM